MILYIFGAGGHAKVIAESALNQEKISNICFIDYSFQQKEFINQNKKYTQIVESEIPNNFLDELSIIGIGNNQIRRGIASKFSSAQFTTILGSLSVVSKSANISLGCFIGNGAIINADSSIGMHSIINTQAVIEHDCKIGDFSHIGPSTVVAGGSKIGKNNFIGGGSFVNPNISICDNVLIGSGSVVIEDIKDPGSYVGSPVRKIK